MADNNDNGNRPGFDPHSAPTMIEQSPFRGAEPPPAYQPPKAAEPPPGPKDIGALLSEAFNLYKKNFVPFLLVALVGMGPIALLTSGLTAGIAGMGAVAGSSLQGDADQMKDLQQKMQDAAARNDQAEVQRLAQEQMQLGLNAVGKSAGALAGFGAMLLMALLVAPLMLIAYLLTQAALTAMAVDRAREGSLSWQGAWGAVFRRFGSLAGAGILVAVGTAIGFLMCFVPGLLFAFISCFTILVVFKEKRGGVDAIKRSFEVVKADPARVFLVLLVFGILSALARFVLAIVIPSSLLFLHGFVGQLGSILVAPFGLIGLALLFDDIRRNKMNLSADQQQAEDTELVPQI